MADNDIRLLQEQADGSFEELISAPTGTGALVFGTSPLFTTQITTPKVTTSSGDLTLNGTDSVAIRANDAMILESRTTVIYAYMPIKPILGVDLGDTTYRWGSGYFNTLIQVPEITTSSGNLSLTPNSGTVAVTGSITVSGTVDGRDVLDDGQAGDNLVTLSGVARDATHLGTFSGTTITDSSTVKTALDELETYAESITGNATHTGDVSGSTTLTIAADAVTYAKMQNVAADERLLGNIAGVDSIITELTQAQVLTFLGGVEAGADVTDETNVATAGAVMSTDLGTNVETWLQTPSSTNLQAAVTGETGSGALVFGTSPLFTTQISTPQIVASGGSLEILKFTGVASAVNEVTITNAITTEAPIIGATGGDTNIDLVLEPKGTGALQASSYGNSRGTNAVDLQTSHTAVTQIALGQSATIGGGNSNTASGINSTISGGSGALAPLYGQDAYAAGSFAANGDAQCSILVARATTTDTTATELLLGGIDRLVVPINIVWAFEITIVMTEQMQNDNTTRSRKFHREGIIQNDNGDVTLSTIVDTIGTDTYIVTAIGSVSITADTTNDALKIEVTGSATTNIHWVAKIELVEVGYPA